MSKSKGNKTAQPAATLADATATAVAVLSKPAVVAPLYNLGKKPRNGLNEGTKHGTGGTAGTYAAVCVALADGPKTISEIASICKANGDAGFARYAVRNHWLLPVEVKAS